ncbi:Putative rRNA methylase [Malonomonas rubra DSM 5091]|uniref:Putative rRNA methylase n=1 Tax=Malonomonas rubra DSM 5091 TaxID=1122189 RepID=A0A1M6M6Z8_MALRU|nr:class I SAM-dependent methyltransferase [Malonomonas rubra]SHJ79224.1 Putative rRNA methylase [Malonomonas rubra DSM 5091]
MSKHLTRIVGWGHELLAEKISNGQLAVDLTAGNGYDTLMLWRQVGPSGQVIAFDIQQEALTSTCLRLQEQQAPVRQWAEGSGVLVAQAGVDLIAAGHQDLATYLPGAPQAIVANLGYFPSGDKSITTLPKTTLQALSQSVEVLAPGGRLAVVVYTGHPGGEEEGRAVDRFFSELDEVNFQVLQLRVLNRPDAPYLLVAEKRERK